MIDVLITKGPHPDVFDARAAVHRWWGLGLRKRRPGFSPNQQEVVLEDLTAELHKIEGSDETGVPLAIPSDNQDNSKCNTLPNSDTPCCSNSLV